MLQSDLCDFNGVVKGHITVTDPNNDAYDKNQLLKIMHHLFLAFQKLIIGLLTTLKIWIL